MRALWIDSMNDADWEKAKAHKMTALYYAVTDPLADVQRRVAESKARGYTPGVYMAWNWPEFSNLSGTDMAEQMHSLVAGVEQAGVSVKVQFNDERHDPTQIRGMLSRWRSLRPTKDTSWTMEGGQGGWMTPEFVAAIVALKVRLVPQLYNGPMTEVWDSLTYTRDLTKRGFPDSIISPFYDAAALPVGYDGFVFTMGRLP